MFRFASSALTCLRASPDNAAAVPYRFRLATPEDIPEIVRLVNAAYRVEDFFKLTDRTDADEVRSDMAKGAFILALDESGQLAGSVAVRANGERGYLGMLSVHPARQRTGLGKALITEAERYATERGCRVMELTYVNVREDLPAYYGRFGYEATGTGPFAEPEKARFPVHFVIMRKSLTANGERPATG